MLSYLCLPTNIVCSWISQIFIPWEYSYIAVTYFNLFDVEKYLDYLTVGSPDFYLFLQYVDFWYFDFEIYIGPEASTAYLGHVVCIPSDPCGQWARRHGARNQWGRGKDFSARKWSCSRAVEVITYVLIQNQLIF